MNLALGIPVVEDELLDLFAIEIIKAPADKDQTAFRLCLGDYAKARALLSAAEHPTFVKRLMQLRNNMPKSDRLVSKDDFMIECKEQMSACSGALRLEWAKFYAKMAGFVEDGTVINNTMHVISVPVQPQAQNERDVTAWEASTMQHQAALQHDAKQLNRGVDE